jgi:hypothetical protein
MLFTGFVFSAPRGIRKPLNVYTNKEQFVYTSFLLMNMIKIYFGEMKGGRK